MILLPYIIGTGNGRSKVWSQKEAELKSESKEANCLLVVTVTQMAWHLVSVTTESIYNFDIIYAVGLL